MSNCIDRMWLLFSSCKAVAVGPEVVAVPPEIFFVWVGVESWKSLRTTM